MVGVTGRGGKNSKAVREFKAQGNKAMQSGAFHKAVRTYTKALELDAGNAILYSNRSAAHFNLREFAESLQDAESAILCDGSLWKAYKRKGLALIHMQRYEEAIAALEHGLTLVGKNVEMEKNLEFARACQEQAQNLYILPEPHMMQRLESVPVFIVTDLVGQPFFVTYDDGQQVCTFYFDKQDAVATLDWIKSENPGLGDTARVIHITLNQAFNLAQETQKQYYEETTRAAAEEDRRLALEAEAKLKADKEGGSKADADAAPDADKKEDQDSGDVTEADDKGAEESSEEKKETAEEKADSTEEKGDDNGDAADEKKDDEEEKEAGDEKDGENKEADDAIIDENAPLSFQFRPELRQVQIAVELLNKTPNPRVRPILRDPPSVRKAKAEAAAAAAKEAEEKMNAETAKEEAAKAEEGTETGDAEASTKAEEGGNEEADKQDEEKTGDTGAEDSGVEKDGEKDEEKEESEATANDEKDAEESTDKLGDDDVDDVELTVDNFNGIPIFQAKGMTLLQKSRQLIPLFFSKWDLEAAWEQLKGSHLGNVPDEIEIEVGTLEDVLRRMSENKTEELDSVFFVPSRESMKAINVKFPLDELTGPPLGANRPAVRKAGFSKAKQIAARGGSKDEIRAAIREDLEKYAERKKMAEVISQIEHARRTGGVGSPGGGFGSGGGSSARSANKKVAA